MAARAKNRKKSLNDISSYIGQRPDFKIIAQKCSSFAFSPKLSSCRQRRLWSDWADAQAALSLRWAHMPAVFFVVFFVLLLFFCFFFFFFFFFFCFFFFFFFCFFFFFFCFFFVCFFFRINSSIRQVFLLYCLFAHTWLSEPMLHVCVCSNIYNILEWTCLLRRVNWNLHCLHRHNCLNIHC